MNRLARLSGAALLGCATTLFVSCGSGDNDSLTGPTQLSPSITPPLGQTGPKPSGPLSVSVEWEPLATASVVAGHNQESYRFTANVTGGVAPYTYRWSFGDGTGPVEGNPVAHKFYSPGTYSVVVIVRDAAGTVVRSDANGELKIEIVAAPFSLSCHVSPTEGEAPLAVTLRAEPTGNVGPVTWNWVFGDGTGSDQRIVSHIYDPQGYAGKARLTATATATDGQGRSVRCSQQIVVAIPNCVHTWTSTCVAGRQEAVAIGADGCLESGSPQVAPPPTGQASAELWNGTPVARTVRIVFAGGDSESFSLSPWVILYGYMFCPPAGSPYDGPLRFEW